MLDKKGLVLSAIIGAVLYWVGSEYLLLMLIFLGIAVLATKYLYFNKKEMGIYEHERSWENVLSNGAAPMIFALLAKYYGIGPIPFLCSIAAVTADKFASELGVLGGDPVYLKTFKHVKPGTSGAVSLFGTFMSLGGATIIGAISIFLFHVSPTAGLYISIAGFLGSVVDTLFGVFEQEGFGTKGTTNFICSMFGGILGHLLVIKKMIV